MSCRSALTYMVQTGARGPCTTPMEPLFVGGHPKMTGTSSSVSAWETPHRGRFYGVTDDILIVWFETRASSCPVDTNDAGFC